MWTSGWADGMARTAVEAERSGRRRSFIVGEFFFRNKSVDYLLLLLLSYFFLCVINE